jgi:hypothetical protein
MNSVQQVVAICDARSEKRIGNLKKELIQKVNDMIDYAKAKQLSKQEVQNIANVVKTLIKKDQRIHRDYLQNYESLIKSNIDYAINENNQKLKLYIEQQLLTLNVRKDIENIKEDISKLKNKLDVADALLQLNPNAAQAFLKV